MSDYFKGKKSLEFSSEARNSLNMIAKSVFNFLIFNKETSKPSKELIKPNKEITRNFRELTKIFTDLRMFNKEHQNNLFYLSPLLHVTNVLVNFFIGFLTPIRKKYVQQFSVCRTKS